MKNILIINRHQVVSEGLKVILQSIFISATIYQISDWYELGLSAQPNLTKYDLIVMQDINCTNGVLHDLAKRRPQLKILVIKNTYPKQEILEGSKKLMYAGMNYSAHEITNVIKQLDPLKKQ